MLAYSVDITTANFEAAKVTSPVYNQFELGPELDTGDSVKLL